ncbi:MAG: PIN domain-containing protein [Acidobacteriota bacterium]|nr:PIN domain-containing protein [Acidobacteriota bacterium]
MSNYTALFDANVLYPAPLRDVLMQLAITDLFRAKWSADIHREWIEALIRNEPHRDRGALERTRDLMDTNIRDCLVTGYASLIPSLKLPDGNDRHVLAAAIVGRCDVIVTQNLKDFPDSALAPYGIAVQHPDEFLCNHLNLAQGLFCSAIQRVRCRLKNPPYTTEQYLEILTGTGLVATAAELRPFADLL